MKFIQIAIITVNVGIIIFMTSFCINMYKDNRKREQELEISRVSFNVWIKKDREIMLQRHSERMAIYERQKKQQLIALKQLEAYRKRLLTLSLK